VLQQVAHGHTDKAIAVLLDIEPCTVQRYLVQAREKLLASNRREAVRVALQLGLIRQPR
jgi:DNA-binding NarL/FixJ family response regulator